MHSGQFKKGYDSRRQGRQREELYKGLTIGELAAQHSHDCVRVLACLVNGIDPTDPMGEAPQKIASASKIKAATILLAYAHGKPVDSIKLVEAQSNQEGIKALTTNQLLTIINQSEPATVSPDS